MALRKKVKPKETAQQKREREAMEALTHRCINCEHAYLMRDVPNNPIVAMCPLKNNDREVARMFVCMEKDMFKERQGEPIIHPMIYITKTIQN